MLFISFSGAITSQNGTAPKRRTCRRRPAVCAITSQNGTAPKPSLYRNPGRTGAITSQNGTAPKLLARRPLRVVVRLPVRTALLQNMTCIIVSSLRCDYQSERHCSKTLSLVTGSLRKCDYQSERHCSKTRVKDYDTEIGAITSQNGTAPKRPRQSTRETEVRLPVRTALLQNWGPEDVYAWIVRLPVRTALLQNWIPNPPINSVVRLPVRTALLQNRTLVKQT